jgi:hypothetical protein
VQVGDLVKLHTFDYFDYPQYQGYLGLLVEETEPTRWKIMIRGRIHPYSIHSVSFEKVWHA